MATNRTRLDRLEQAREQKADDDGDPPRVAGKPLAVVVREQTEFHRRKLANRTLSPTERSDLESLIAKYEVLTEEIAERDRLHRAAGDKN